MRRRPTRARSAGAAAAVLAIVLAAPPAGATVPRYGPVQELVTLPKPPGREWAAVPTTAVGDFNGDGLDDLLVTRAAWPSDERFDVLVLLNDGFGRLTDGSSSWEGAPARAIFPYRIAVADFNGDGVDDAFLADTGSDTPPFPGAQSSLVLSTEGGKVRDATASLPQQSAYTYFTDAADVDLDGDQDLYLGNTIRLTPQILLNDGRGRFTILPGALPAALDPPANPTAGRFADVDVDGDPDLVVAGADAHADGYRFPANTFVLVNDGRGRFSILGGSLPPKPFHATGEAVDLKVLELNGDRAPDLVISWTKGIPYYYGRFLQVLVNDGSGRYRDETASRLPQVDNLESALETLEVHDVDRNGAPDIFAIVLPRAPNFDEVAPFFLNDGAGRFATLRDGLGTDTGNTATMLDLDGDGGLDVVFTKDVLKLYARRELAAPVSTLYATASSAFVTTETGVSTNRIRAGRYQFVVRDASPRAGFLLRGPGVSRSTSRAFVGRAAWRIVLRPGVYRFGSTTARSRHALRVSR